MGIPTLIKTLTASGDASLSFVDGAASVTLDSTYDEYMFVFTDINPATDSAEFSFQVNATDDAGGGYDTSLFTAATFYSSHKEDGSNGALQYTDTHDQGQGSAFQPIAWDVGNGSDESCAGILHLFSPASTTYVKHFYSRVMTYEGGDRVYEAFTSGYINDATAIDEIQFKMSSGNFDGVIQMYGIA